MSVGCLEPQFFKVFIEKFVDVLPETFLRSEGWTPTAQIQNERERWPRLEEFLSRGFKTATRDFWTKTFHGKPSFAIHMPFAVRIKSTCLPVAY